MNTVVLTVGDWGGDGHNMRDDVPVETNFRVSQIKEAYKKGVEICEVDLAALVDDFEESTIPSEDLRKLHKNGLLEGWNFDEESLTEDFSLAHDPDAYAELYLRIAKLGNQDLQFKILDLETLDIGGYGLYYSQKGKNVTSTFNEFSSSVVMLVDDIGEDFVRIRFEMTPKGGRLVGIREDGQQARRNCYDGWAGKRWRETEDFLAHHCQKPFEVVLDYD